MKIYYITNARIPTEKANGYQIMMNCASFAKQGVEVELWVPTRANEIKTDPFTYYGIKKNFKIRWVKSFDALHWLKWIPRFGFHLQSLLFFFSLISKKVEQDAIIYSRSPEILFLFILRGYKTVWESHGVYRRLLFKQWFFKRVRSIIVLTNLSRERYIQLGVTEAKITTAPDAVDLEVFDISISKEEARAKLNLPADKSFLGYFGSMNTVNIKKGMDEIIQALKQLPKNVFLLSVGGNDADIALYKKQAKEEGVEDRIYFKGRVARDILAVYQKATDILLMPFPWVEHFAYFMSPMKMFEYMAAKRPIITTDLPATREILDEHTAMIIPPGNGEKLREAITDLLDHPEKGETIAENAYEKVKNYTWQKRAEKILDFIKDKTTL